MKKIIAHGGLVITARGVTGIDSLEIDKNVSNHQICLRDGSDSTIYGLYLELINRGGEHASANRYSDLYNEVAVFRRTFRGKFMLMATFNTNANGKYDIFLIDVNNLHPDKFSSEDIKNGTFRWKSGRIDIDPTELNTWSPPTPVGYRFANWVDLKHIANE